MRDHRHYRFLNLRARQGGKFTALRLQAELQHTSGWLCPEIGQALDCARRLRDHGFKVALQQATGTGFTGPVRPEFKKRQPPIMVFAISP